MKSLRLILTNVNYFGPSWVFASLNILFGTWAIYIPQVKESLAIDNSELGFAIFFLSLGVFIVFPFASGLVNRLGVGKATFYGVLLSCAAAMLPLLAPSYYTLMGALFLFGASNGFTDIAMNTLVTEVEKKDEVKFMSAAHGFFSLGGVLGATLGSILMPIFNLPVYHMLTISVFIILINLVLTKYYFSITEEQYSKETNTYSLKKIRPLIAIAFIAFVIMSSEGAIEHWSSLYLLEVVQITKQNLAGLGFIVFSVMMTIGRFFGDGISAKIGSIKIILLGCVLASIGYLCILVSQLIITVLGFAIVGLGLSVIIPELFRMAGKAKGVKASVGISIVSGIGFSGFLLGPVVLGYISNTYNLKISFLALLVLTGFALLIAILKLRRGDIT